jgi:FixJ family two-component response regulator
MSDALVNPIPVLAFVPREDRPAMTAIFDKDFRPLFVDTLPEMLDALHHEPIPVLVCDTAFEGGTWKDVSRAIQSVASPPQLVVVSRNADLYDWGEVLRAGGRDLIQKPYDSKETLKSVWWAAYEWLKGKGFAA